MSRKQFLSCHDSADISELMAYDRLKNEEYRNKLKSKNMSDDERNAQILTMFKKV